MSAGPTLQVISRMLGRKSHRLDAPQVSWRTDLPARLKGLTSRSHFDNHPALTTLRMLTAAAERFGIGNPFFKSHEGVGGHRTCINGRQYLNFSHYNYLGLNGHPEVNKAAQEAMERYGTSAGASRLVAGERPVQRQLEHALAELYGVEDCVVFVSGHATNVTTISTLFGRKASGQGTGRSQHRDSPRLIRRERALQPREVRASAESDGYVLMSS